MSNSVWIIEYRTTPSGEWQKSREIVTEERQAAERVAYLNARTVFDREYRAVEYVRKEQP